MSIKNSLVLIIFFISICPICVYSQSYDIGVDSNDRDNYVICTENVNPGMGLIMNNVSYFFVMHFNEINTKVVDSFKSWNIHLENGEILSGNKYGEDGLLLMSLSLYTSNRKSLRNLSKTEKWNYFIGQLQRYNIKEVTFDVGTKPLSNYRSAETMIRMVNRINDDFKVQLFSPLKSNSRKNSGSSIESIELPFKFEVPDGLNMRTDDANKGEYSGLATHEGGIVGIILHTKTGKYPADAGLDDYEVEITPMNGQTANWISEYGKQASVYAIKIDPNRTNRSRAANLYFKIGGKVQGRLFVLQLAEGSIINW